MKNMMIRDTEGILWNVLTSFGYEEEEKICNRDRYFLLDKKEAVIIEKTDAVSEAQAAAACIESAFACGTEQFEVTVSNKDVYEILILFGFENILKLNRDIKNYFEISSGEDVFAYGNIKENTTVAKIDADKLSSLREVAESAQDSLSKTLVYAEENALGVAYEICYTLRVNGCIVELYCENGDIKTASEYAGKNGHSAIIRCLRDGTVEIKEMSQKDIIKTTLSEFLGYYDDEEGCGCGHDHEHGHDCECGHQHN